MLTCRERVSSGLALTASAYIWRAPAESPVLFFLKLAHALSMTGLPGSSLSAALYRSSAMAWSPF